MPLNCFLLPLSAPVFYTSRSQTLLMTPRHREGGERGQKQWEIWKAGPSGHTGWVLVVPNRSEWRLGWFSATCEETLAVCSNGLLSSRVNTNTKPAESCLLQLAALSGPQDHPVLPNTPTCCSQAQISSLLGLTAQTINGRGSGQNVRAIVPSCFC